MNTKTPIILEVVVPTPVRRNFDYFPPQNLADNTELLPGMRVLVSFGKSKRIALIVKIKQQSELALSKIKPCLELLDQQPIFDQDILSLAQWASTYYHYSLGLICFKMMPTLFRSEKEVAMKRHKYWQISSHTPEFNQLSRAVKQLQCVEFIADSNAAVSAEHLKKSGFSSAQLLSLKEKGYIECIEKQLQPVAPNWPFIEKPQLNDEQQLAITNCHLTSFKVHLLDGITGSGKTEVYLRLIEQKLSENKQVLVLVPEIGLTPQLVKRFEQRLQIPIGLLHSGLNNQQRLENWTLTKNGQLRVLIGTRSALFTPMKDLGLIIIDEEHDASFKQSQGWLYSGRDLALVRARNCDIPIMLGTATPSLETLHHAMTGRYEHLKLRKRPGSASVATFKTLDIRKLPIDHGLSKPLIDNIGKHLSQGNQVIIFLNRRGYAPVLMCHDCGWMAICQRCETSYTLHQSPEHLHCHHCDSTRRVPSECGDCKSNNISPVGVGTERIEQLLLERFPDYPLIRIDRDSTRRKDAMKNYIKDINSGHYKILIGTQMLSKGHHFPDVSLVAIIDMDGALFSSDFRAAEKFGQLLTQVAGRAGRAEKPGTVMLQTHHPDHPELQSLISHGYANFARDLIKERQQCFWPPFSYLAMFRAESTYRENPQRFLKQLADVARQYSSNEHPVSILGPIEAPMPRRAGKYRCQLLLQANSRQSLQNMLRSLIFHLESQKTAKTVRWSLDVDPLEMF